MERVRRGNQQVREWVCFSADLVIAQSASQRKMQRLLIQPTRENKKTPRERLRVPHKMEEERKRGG